MLTSYFNLQLLYTALASKCISRNFTVFYMTTNKRKLPNSNVLNMKNVKNKTHFFGEILNSTMCTSPIANHLINEPCKKKLMKKHRNLTNVARNRLIKRGSQQTLKQTL